MKRFVTDSDGFLVGWCDDDRPGTVAVEPGAIPPARARWTGAAWVEDASREQAAERQALEASCIAAIQERLDAVAQAWGYDDLRAAATYDGDDDRVFAAEAKALKQWRSSTWRAGYRILAEVQAGRRAITSLPELLALLPAAPDRPSA